MAYPFPSSSEPFNQAHLMARLRRTFEHLPNIRRPGGNTRYAMEDAALSAFWVFFMQTPSFLAWQRSMQESQGRNNAQSLFGMHRIPTDNPIRNLLDTVSPPCLYGVFRYVFKGLEQTGQLLTYPHKYNCVINQLDNLSSQGTGMMFDDLSAW